jgi:hypothetical protein
MDSLRALVDTQRLADLDALRLLYLLEIPGRPALPAYGV